MKVNDPIVETGYVFCSIFDVKCNDMGLLIGLSFLGLLMHPVHVSYTYVDVNQEKGEISISHKLYTDDFSLLFYHLYEKEIQFQPDKPLTGSQSEMINAYIRQRFTLVADEDTLALKFLQKELDDEFLWIYYTAAITREEVKNIKVINLLLLDLFMDQTNLMIVTNGNKENGFSFDYNNRQMVLELQE